MRGYDQPEQRPYVVFWLAISAIGSDNTFGHALVTKTRTRLGAIRMEMI